MFSVLVRERLSSGFVTACKCRCDRCKYWAVVSRSPCPSKTWMVRRSVPASNKWVAQLWRTVCGVTCLRMPARCAASLHAIQTVLSEIGSSSLWRRVRVGNMYSFGFRHRQYSRNVSNSAGLRGRSRSFATLARHHTDDHALTIDVADFKTSEFAASHAGAIERHQQRPSKQVPG